jgi:hypothetical protein
MSVNKELRDSINENETLDGAVILDNPSFDKSIVGYTSDGRLVYDFDKMVVEFADDNDLDEYIDAIEFIEYNTERALPYMGERAPLIIYKDGLGI